MSAAASAFGRGLLAFPQNEHGIGDMIMSVQSPKLIADVRVEPYSVWPDDRGYFAEVLRTGQGLVSSYASGPMQVSAALSYPGTVKAFHHHQEQTDLWAPVLGVFQVALVDLRPDSTTFGKRNTFYLGPLRPWQVLIPPGVAHGYKVVSPEPGMLVYATNRFYNPDDEGRIPYNHPGINYDWELQHK